MRLFIYQLRLLPLFILMGCGSVETTQDQNDSLVLDESYLYSEDNVSVEEDRNGALLPLVREELAMEYPDEITALEEEEEELIVEEVALPTATIPMVEAEREEEALIPSTVALNYTQKFINEQDCDQIIDKEFLVICYDKARKVAKSVAYTLAGDLMNELNIQDRPNFYEEESIEEPYRAKLSDYRGSGYDRGHLAPDAAFDWSQESLDATYSLANIIPQVPTVNQRMWVDVEGYARSKALELGQLNVVNVIAYNDNTLRIGEGNISVSTGYYKILYGEESSYEECFYYANNPDANSTGDTLLTHLVTCDGISNN